MKIEAFDNGMQTIIDGLPHLLPCRTADIAFLRPTQFAVGLREVAAKRQKMEKRAGCSRAALDRQLPVIFGPGRQFYLHDRHHYAIALFQMGVDRVEVSVVADLSHLDPETFWLTLSARSWARPFDGQGVRRPFECMPDNIFALEDDPFRSLAGALRRRGVYGKTNIAHADFVWADFLRHRIAITHDFESAVDQAERLIHTNPEACDLPGLRQIAEAGQAASESRPGRPWDASPSGT